MALTPIESYHIPHDKGNGTGGSTYIMGGPKSYTYNSINVNSINAKNGNIDNIYSKNISADNATILYLQTKEGMITKLSGDQLDYRSGYIGSLTSDNITTNKLKAEDIEAMNAFISTLQSKEITTEYLTVTKQAHFFELIIDKIRSVGGQLIITPASCIVDYVKGHLPNGTLVEPNESNYSSIDYFIIYWRAEDDDGRAVDNGFMENDQAICQSFNNVHVGTNYNVSNKYYWRLVNGILDDTYINLTTGAETTQPTQAKNNQYSIIMSDTKTKRNENEYYNNGINWTVKEQRIDGIETNVDWINGQRLNEKAVNGTFISASQVYGIQITPDKDYITSYLEFTITQNAGNNTIVPTKINIGVYFKDDTFRIWNNVHLGDGIDNYGYCRLDLEDADAPIEAITIVSGADVNWHYCHRMKLSNIDKDQELVGHASIPSVGDNIVQLGYRTTYNNPDDDPNINRQSAIIISAYESIDTGGMLQDGTIIAPIVAPSYTQYIGIDDFNLFTHRQSYIDGKGARFIGDISLCSVNGKGLNEAIEDTGKMIIVDTASVMMNTRDGADEVVSITPNKINIKILVVENGETQQIDIVPTDHKIEIGYFNANGTLWNKTTFNAGDSISNIYLLYDSNINTISNIRIIFSKTVTSGSTNKTIVIDQKEIPYIRTATANTAGRYEFRYCNFTPTTNNPTPTKPTDYSNGLGTFSGCTWDVSVASPDSEHGEFTYMTQCFRNAGGSYDVWTDPIRITGANGKDGEDGSDIEYIYTRNNTGVAPQAPSGTNWGDDWPNVDGNTPSAQDNHGTTWYDNPQGVTSSIMYEYVSMRQKSHGGNWTTYCTPVIWSKWGEKGQDGDGYEYIFKLTDEPSSSNVANPTPNDWETNSNYQNSNEYVSYLTNQGWTDDPPSVTQSQRYLYVSVRQRKQQKWGRFSDPSLWARYASQGETGGHYEFRYRNAANLTSSDKPTGTGLTNGWSTQPSNPDIAHGIYTWMSQCYVTPNVSGDSYGPWSDPVRITGGNGSDGTDGTDIEFVYTTTNSTTQVPTPIASGSGDDWHGESGGHTWYDNPQGVTQNMKYEWMSMRFKRNSTWGSYTTPVIWSAYGDKGMDGDGYEYIFKLSGGSTPDSNKPSTPTTSLNQDDYVPSGWSDDPLDTTPTNRWQWVCIRKKHNGTWGSWEGPTLWSNYSLADQAVPGTDGKDAEVDLLIPLKELFYADVKTAYVNNPPSKVKVKINLSYQIAKKVGDSVITQSLSSSGYTLRLNYYNSQYQQPSGWSSGKTVTLSSTSYSSNDVMSNLGSSNSDYIELSSNSSTWNNVPTYATVSLLKNNTVLVERQISLLLEGGAFRLTLEEGLRDFVGSSIETYDENLQRTLNNSYVTRTSLRDQISDQVNTVISGPNGIEQRMSTIEQNGEEIALTVQNQYTKNDLKTLLNNAGVVIGANSSEQGYINLNGDNVNVNGTLNVYNKSGVGIAVWNGTKSTASNSTQIVNKSLGPVQGWSVSNLSGGDHIVALNIIGIDGMLLNSPGQYANRYKKFLWWGDTQYDHKSGSNGYEFIVRNLMHNFRVSENGILRTSAQNTFNSWQNLDSFYDTDGKDILTNEDIRSSGSAGANMRWSDLSSTTPVCIFTEREKNFTKASVNTSNAKFPDAMFRTCGIFIAQGGNTTIWLPCPDYCIGRTVWFRCKNGSLTFKMGYNMRSGMILPSGTNNKVNTYEVGNSSVQLVSDGDCWIVFRST